MRSGGDINGLIDVLVEHAERNFFDCGLELLRAPSDSTQSTGSFIREFFGVGSSRCLKKSANGGSCVGPKRSGV
jgi:hypothetical protein